LFFMIGQTIGRAICTYLSSTGKMDCTRLTGVCTILMLISHSVCTVSTDLNTLTAFFWIIAASYGSLWVTMAPTVMELCGMNALIALYGVYALAPGYAPMLFGQISGKLYDNEGQTDSTGAVDCYGHECFYVYFIIGDVALACGVLMFLAVLYRQQQRKQRLQTTEDKQQLLTATTPM